MKKNLKSFYNSDDKNTFIFYVLIKMAEQKKKTIEKKKKDMIQGELVKETSF